MASTKIPLPYQLFFLWIEPFSTIVGAFYAWFQPTFYLAQTHAPSAPSGPGLLGTSDGFPPLSTHVVLRQLGNLYLAFTLNEALVLRSTTDLRVWRTLLLTLLIADFGHLYSCFPLGLEYYYDVANWNAIAWGNIAFVYCGAATRVCFLSGVGFPESNDQKGKRIGNGKGNKKENENENEIKIPDELEIDLLGTTSSPMKMDASPAQGTRRRKAKGKTG